jgi:SanA protein
LFIVTLVITIALLLPGIFLLVWLLTKSSILPMEKALHYHYCLVLGAGLEKDGQPSDILKDRVATAQKLYKNKKVDRLIMSGTCRRAYDEPAAMQTTAVAQGIPQADILLDPAGISTLDSCINFLRDHKDETPLIVTQRFHLPRAILLARMLRVDAYGVAACIYRFSWYKRAYWYLRELFALPYNFFKLLLYLFK